MRQNDNLGVRSVLTLIHDKSTEIFTVQPEIETDNGPLAKHIARSS